MLSNVAAAVGLALHVVEPHMNGIGGEAPALLYSAKERKVFAISGQGTAPEKATPQFFKENGIDMIPGDGLLPATVPASFDVWITLLTRFGTRSLRQVIAPAIRFAEQGFPTYPTLHNNIQANASLFLKQWPSTARIYLPNRKVPEIGQILVQRDLGITLRRLSADGKEGRKEPSPRARDC